MSRGRPSPRGGGGGGHHAAFDDASTDPESAASIATSGVAPLQDVLDSRLRRALVRYHKRDEKRACWRDTQNVRLAVMMVSFVVIVSVAAGVFHAIEGGTMDDTHDNATSFVARMKLRLNGSEYVSEKSKTSNVVWLAMLLATLLGDRRPPHKPYRLSTRGVSSGATSMPVPCPPPPPSPVIDHPVVSLSISISISISPRVCLSVVLCSRLPPIPYSTCAFQV
jgi:hypothetical protein